MCIHGDAYMKLFSENMIPVKISKDNSQGSIIYPKMENRGDRDRQRMRESERFDCVLALCVVVCQGMLRWEVYLCFILSKSR